MMLHFLGLMISACAKAAQALNDDVIVERGMKAWRFVRQHMFVEERSVLLRSCYVQQDGSVSQMYVT